MIHNRYFSFFVLFIGVLLVLSGCVAAPYLIVQPTQVSATKEYPYDGTWDGSAETPTGKSIHLHFDVEKSHLRGVVYDFIGRDGVPCTNISYTMLTPGQSPSVTAKGFNAPLGKDLQLVVGFSSMNSAFGTLTVDWQGRHNCTIQFETTWKASKKNKIVELPVQPRIGNLQCGYGNCMDVLLQLLVFGLSNGAVLALNAISVTVVYGAVRTLNLAHGDVFSLTSVLVTSIVIGLNVQGTWPPVYTFFVLVLCLVVAILFGMLLNIGLEWAAFRPFRGKSRLAPLIATLGISFILFQGAMIWRTHQGSWIPGEHRSVPGLPEVPTDGIPELLPTLNLVRVLGLPFHLTFRFNDLFIILLAIVCAIATFGFLKFSKTGHAIEACMENPTLAQIIGIDINATIRRAFALGGLLAGVAAFVFAIYYGRPFGQNGAQSGLFAFTAAMLGGIGNPLGALVSAFLLGIFSSFSDYLISAEWTPVLTLVLLIGMLLLRPEGILAERPIDDPSSSIVREVLTTGSRPRKGKTQLLFWVLTVLAVFPVFSSLSGLGWQIMVRGIGIFIFLALGLNILLGLAGVLDLGYVAAFGIGAYGAAIITNPWGLFKTLFPNVPDFLFILVFCAVLSGCFGLIKGLLTRRLRTDYLALATLALGLFVSRLVVNLKFLTGGAAGISALPAPKILGFSFGSSTAGYYLIFVLLVLAIMMSEHLVLSRTGRAWHASSEDESAAEASGIQIGRYRLLAMIISSAMAGVAGALYASTFAYVDPDILSFHWTAMLLAMVVLGGAGSVSGVVLGAILIIGYDKFFIPYFSALISLVWPKNFFIGSVPDLRGTSFLNFGLILYLTVLVRTRLHTRK